MEPDTPFPYDVTIGEIDYTVLAPEGEPGYRVRLPDGQVTAYPANSGDPSPENAAADIAHALAAPPEPIVDQATVWAAMLAGNITDPVTSIPLRASIATRDILTATLVMLREAETAGQINGDTPQTIWDADNVERTLTVNELRGLILRYGFAWQQMHANYAP